METGSKEVCIPFPSEQDALITEQCSSPSKVTEWQNLERFWDDEKRRLQDYDSPQNQELSNSLEDHFLFDEYIPEDKQEDKSCTDEELSYIVKGSDINDIPAQFAVTGLRSNEHIVIGTFIDKNIIPGFKYLVRKNHTEKYLFDGKALQLNSIGLGYGKRLTFESKNLNDNKNYFWSDSWQAGFGFALQSVAKGDKFVILDKISGKYNGRAIVTKINGSQTELSTTLDDCGRVEKVVRVRFSCNVVMQDSTTKQSFVVKNMTVCGNAVLIKNGPYDVAIISKILPIDFIKECEFKPEN